MLRDALPALAPKKSDVEDALQAGDGQEVGFIYFETHPVDILDIANAYQTKVM